MILTSLDGTIIFLFFLISLIIGISVSQKAGRDFSHFFLAGGKVPWWLLGLSMVATTFSADTPHLVTDIVRQHGVFGNWMWWAFLLTGMLTVFVYARLWRRCGFSTDLEFYELRYSGRGAAFLRCFRALYLGVFFNVMVMASVTLAAIKIGGALFGFSPAKTVMLAVIITGIYSFLGGLRGVMLTDVVQFVIAMIGSVAIAVVAVNHAGLGSIATLLSHPEVEAKLSFMPHPGIHGWEATIAIFIIPISVQWWSVYYPGAEPGGGGYVVQRMLAAKNEQHALGGTLLFNIAHYAIRPWPWIITALASIVIFPDLASLQQRFPHLSEQIIRHDLAYPAMMGLLPQGMLGLVIASILAAYMSTMSTHLNWGASYIANDVYKRFIKPEASEKEVVRLGRLSTIFLIVCATVMALLLENALQIFMILMQIGAGTGLLLILRWFWWRINAFSEITAMIISFLVAFYFQIIHQALGYPALKQEYQLLIGVAVTTLGWVIVTFLTAPAEEKTLIHFYRNVKPAGPGWNTIREKLKKAGAAAKDIEPICGLAGGILCTFCAVMIVYGLLFGTGFFLYGKLLTAVAIFALLPLPAFIIFNLVRRQKV